MKGTVTSASPETQELIDLLLSLQDRPEALALLREKAETRLEEMHRAADSFFSQVDSQGAEFYQEFRSHFDAMEDQFRNYADALEDILEESFDPRRVAEALAHASRGLKLGMARYEEAYLSRGPSRYPVVNLFSNVSRAVEEGRTPKEAWAATCHRYQTFYSQALEEIVRSRAAAKPGVPERRTAIEAILSCLQELREAEGSDAVTPILTRLSAAHTDLDRAFDLYHQHEFSQGPTRAPRLNWLIKAARGVLAGTYEARVLESLAQELLDTTQQNLQEMRALSRDKLDSAVLTDELDHMLDAVEGLEEALLVLLDFAQGAASDRKQVEEAIQELVQAGDDLVESINIVAEVHERAGKVTCVQCQALQEKGSNACVSCGAVLPPQPEAGIYSHGSSSFQVLEGDPADVDRDQIMTDVMHQLFERCEAFLRGRETAEGVRVHVERGLRDVEQARAGLTRLQSPMLGGETSRSERELARDFIDLADDALILLDQGVAECRRGLLDIGDGAAADDFERVRAGMRNYFEGVQKMWQVKRLERQFSQYLGETGRGPS